MGLNAKLDTERDQALMAATVYLLALVSIKTELRQARLTLLRPQTSPAGKVRASNPQKTWHHHSSLSFASSHSSRVFTTINKRQEQWARASIRMAAHVTSLHGLPLRRINADHCLVHVRTVRVFAHARIRSWGGCIVGCLQCPNRGPSTYMRSA